jgi:hypothetical protein
MEKPQNRAKDNSKRIPYLLPTIMWSMKYLKLKEKNELNAKPASIQKIMPAL